MYFNTASIQFPAVLYLYWVTNTGMNNDDGWNGCKHFAGLDADVQIAAVIMAVLLWWWQQQWINSNDNDDYNKKIL